MIKVTVEFKKIAISVLLTFILHNSNAIAQSQQTKVTKLTVCSHELPPHTFSSSDGIAKGLASEVLLHIAKDLGWNIEISYSSWVRLRGLSELGTCDIAYTALKKVDYLNFFEYPKEALPDRRAVFIVKSASNIIFDGNLENFLKKYSVGLYKDKAVNDEFDKLKKMPWAKVQEPVRPDLVFPMLLNGRFDAAIEEAQVAIFELKKINKLNQLKFLEPPIQVTPAYIVFPKKGKALGLIKDFDQSFAKFKKSDAYKLLLEKYGY